MSEIPISILIGLLTGILTALIAWWILFHCIIPRIHFSSSISKTPTQDDKSGYRYRFKLENAGRRSIIDVELMARLRIKGLLADYPNNWEVINIPLGANGRRYKIPRILPIRRRRVRYIMRLYVNRVDEFREPIYPEHIRRKAEKQSLLLEDILSLGSQATLQIHAFGYDEFSGARKLFISKFYTIHDIKEGPFEEKGLDVQELTIPE